MKMTCAIQKKSQGKWQLFDEFVTESGAATRVLKLRKLFKQNLYRVVRL